MTRKKWSRKQLVNNLETMIDEHKKALAYYAEQIETTKPNSVENYRAYTDYASIAARVTLLEELHYNV